MIDAMLQNTLPMLETINKIAHQYDVYLIDLWGVTHNGVAPFEDAIRLYAQLKSQGKTLIILSNAPRLAAITRTRLIDMGIDFDTLFDDVMTSGVECHADFRDRGNAFYQNLGSKLLHIGPERDRTVFEGLDYQSVNSIDDAEFLLVTGTEGWHTTTDSYRERLEQALVRKLPMVCANADKLVQNGDDLVICAGAIAQLYRSMGATEIFTHGKPNISVYESVHAMANTIRSARVDKSRMLMLGDSLATDITGATNYGIDSVLTLSGVHGKTELINLPALFAEYGVTPTYVMTKIC